MRDSSESVKSAGPAIVGRSRQPTATVLKLRVEICAADERNPAGLNVAPDLYLENKVFRRMCDGPALALACIDERSVLRASVFSIVLVLAIGQDTALLCRMWCHPGGAPAAECYEHMDTIVRLSVAGDDSCGRVDSSGPILVREDPAGISDRVARCASLVPRHLVPAAPCEMNRRPDTGRALPLESRPLVLALRV